MRPLVLMHPEYQAPATFYPQDIIGTYSQSWYLTHPRGLGAYYKSWHLIHLVQGSQAITPILAPHEPRGLGTYSKPWHLIHPGVARLLLLVLVAHAPRGIGTYPQVMAPHTPGGELSIMEFLLVLATHAPRQSQQLKSPVRFKHLFLFTAPYSPKV